MCLSIDFYTTIGLSAVEISSKLGEVLLMIVLISVTGRSDGLVLGGRGPGWRGVGRRR